MPREVYIFVTPVAIWPSYIYHQLLTTLQRFSYSTFRRLSYLNLVHKLIILRTTMAPKRKATHGPAKPPKKGRLDTASRSQSLDNDSEATIASDDRSQQSSDSSMDLDGPTTVTSNTKATKKSSNAKIQNTQEEWELLGDTRDQLEVGVEAPQRLILHLRNKSTGEEKTHNCNDKDEVINWNDKIQVNRINKSRHQYLRRYGFANKVDHLFWIPQEIAYLELMYERLWEKSQSDTSAQLPQRARIFEAFNNFFAGRTDIIDDEGQPVPERPHRKIEALDSYVRRPNTQIRILRDRVLAKLKSSSDDAWLPEITDEDIDVHISESSKGKKKAASKPKAKKLPNAKPKKSSSKPKTNTAKDIIEAPAAESSQTSSMTDTPLAQEQTSPDPDNAAESTAPAEPDNTEKLAKKRTKKQTFTERRVTTEEEMATLKADGWNVREVPRSNDEALQRYGEHRKDVEVRAKWPIPPDQAVDERLGRKPVEVLDYYSRNGDREGWHSDLESGVEYMDDGDGNQVEIATSERRATAAATNAVLNYAILPPLGYQGDIRKLRDDPRMPEDERTLARLNREGQQKLSDAYDAAYEKSEKDVGTKMIFRREDS
jgi:hypothetical protein